MPAASHADVESWKQRMEKKKDRQLHSNYSAGCAHVSVCVGGGSAQ